MPIPLRTEPPDPGSSPMGTDPCTVPTLIKMIAPHPDQLFGQGEFEKKNSHLTANMHNMDPFQDK